MEENENELVYTYKRVEKKSFNRSSLWVIGSIVIIIIIGSVFYNQKQKGDNLKLELAISDMKHTFAMLYGGTEIKPKVYVESVYGKYFEVLNSLNKFGIELQKLIIENDNKNNELTYNLLSEQSLKGVIALNNTKRKIEQLSVLSNNFYINNQKIADNLVAEARTYKSMDNAEIDAFINAFLKSFKESTDNNKKISEQYINDLTKIVNLFLNNPKSYNFQNGNIIIYDNNVLTLYNNYITDIDDLRKQQRNNESKILN